MRQGCRNFPRAMKLKRIWGCLKFEVPKSKCLCMQFSNSYRIECKIAEPSYSENLFFSFSSAISYLALQEETPCNVKI